MTFVVKQELFMGLLYQVWIPCFSTVKRRCLLSPAQAQMVLNAVLK